MFLFIFDESTHVTKSSIVLAQRSEVSRLEWDNLSLPGYQESGIRDNFCSDANMALLNELFLISATISRR
jgi:hypothetical protein